MAKDPTRENTEGRNVARIRASKGWTQMELAKESGINKATISQIETGAIGLSKDKRETLAKALGVEIGEFYKKEGSAADQPQMPEHLRLLHAEIDRAVLASRSVAEQYELASKVLKLLQEK